MVLKTCPNCLVRTPVACKRCRNCNFEFKKKPKVVLRQGSGSGSPTEFEVYNNSSAIPGIDLNNTWYTPPAAKKLRASQDCDLITAIEDAIKFAETKVVKTDNIALSLFQINRRIVNQDKLWYHLKKADEMAEEDDTSTTDMSSSYQDIEDNKEDDLFVQTVRNLDPTEQKDTPIQLSVIVQSSKKEKAVISSEKEVNSLPLKSPLRPTSSTMYNGVASPSNQMFATYTPGMGMKYFVLPRGWNCYQVRNRSNIPTVMSSPVHPATVVSTRLGGSVSSRDSSSMDEHFSAQNSPVQNSSVLTSPMQNRSVLTSPMQNRSVLTSPIQNSSALNSPVLNSPVLSVPRSRAVSDMDSDDLEYHSSSKGTSPSPEPREMIVDVSLPYTPKSSWPPTSGPVAHLERSACQAV